MSKTTDTKESLTIACHKDSLLDSEYGLVTYENWCLREVQRVDNPDRVYRENGNYCWVD